MSNKRKICVITGTRAEYGLLYWVMKEIQNDMALDLQVIVTGMHLSSEFGLTYKDIIRDGFTIDHSVEMLLSSDSDVGVSKSVGLGIIGFADAINELNPDMILVLGDRFEIFAAASSATIAKIPIAHIHGGEVTEGAFDEAFRHSITKMSHLHFTATEAYRKRVIQLGEHPDSVYNFGAPGIDNIKRLKLLARKEFEQATDSKLAKHNILVTFHPVSLEISTANAQFANLLHVLDELKETHLYFTKANADPGGRVINNMIEDYVKSNSDKSNVYTSLGQVRYLSALQYMDGVVGNSSSGLIEAPSFNIGTINIGDRQRGRIKAESVIDCLPSKKSIRSALQTLYSDEFKKKLKNVKNPYGDGGAINNIIDVIKKTSLDEILKKKFYDIHE